MIHVFLDVNVILDSMLQRSPWHRDSDAILQALTRQQVACSTSTHCLATAYYVGRKTMGAPAARAAIRKHLTAFSVLPVDRQSLLDADAMPGSDFEDNIVIAVAVASSLNAIVTRNVVDFAHSPIPVLMPAELLKRIQLLSPPPATANGPP